jgi:hypothetical protein
VAFSPLANYPDCPTVATSEVVPIFAVGGCCDVAQRMPSEVNLSFLGRSRYFFFQVAPQLTSWGWMDHVQNHYYSENPAPPGIEPGTSVSVARNSWLVAPTTKFNILSSSCFGKHYHIYTISGVLGL